MSAEESDGSVVDLLLRPLDGPDGPAGADLVYDNEFLTLTQAAEGKPETQFRAAVPPDWKAVAEQAEHLSTRTRDVRVALLWARASVRLDGLAALPESLRLMTGLLDGFWDTVHPLPDDDGDPYARVNALASLPLYEGLLGDVREAFVFRLRSVGELKVRTIEAAMAASSTSAASSDESVMGRAEITEMMAAAIAADASIAALPAAASRRLAELQSVIDTRFNAGESIDLDPIKAALRSIVHVMPIVTPSGVADSRGDPDAASDATPEPGFAAQGAAAGRPAGLSGAITTRSEAVRAIDMVCEFLEHTEPTNPAPLLLRRARRLISRNFLQLIQELAPESLNEVARVMGVDPETVLQGDTS